MTKPAANTKTAFLTLLKARLEDTATRQIGFHVCVDSTLAYERSRLVDSGLDTSEIDRRIREASCTVNLQVGNADRVFHDILTGGEGRSDVAMWRDHLAGAFCSAQTLDGKMLSDAEFSRDTFRQLLDSMSFGQLSLLYQQWTAALSAEIPQELFLASDKR